ncbi:gasdermin-C [Eubalaena glacialis]|uniref:gasdermin-C n=1 Tax=Eubalaena glacialis TaxID=27606 RepID=UPI002A5A94EA|nr:gasdermin-C [Eubalaena glacialis]
MVRTRASCQQPCERTVFKTDSPASDVLLISDDHKRKTFPEGEFQSWAGSPPTPRALLNSDPLRMLTAALQGAQPHREESPSQAPPLPPKKLQMQIADILFISDDDKRKTFPEGTMRGPILPVGRIEEPTGQDFKHLQKEVSREMEAMAQLPKDIQDAILHILARLKDQEALQDLMDMLDRGPLDRLDSFGGTFLSEMQENSRNLWLTLRLHIIYLLKAILVLSGTQHELQAWSMEKRILLQQRELVKSILEPNFKYPWNIPFTLDPKLLIPLQEEGVAVTFSLLEECSLRVAPDSPKGTWDLEAEKPLFALYGSLSALQQLAEA